MGITFGSSAGTGMVIAQSLRSMDHFSHGRVGRLHFAGVVCGRHCENESVHTMVRDLRGGTYIAGRAVATVFFRPDPSGRLRVDKHCLPSWFPVGNTNGEALGIRPTGTNGRLRFFGHRRGSPNFCRPATATMDGA